MKIVYLQPDRGNEAAVICLFGVGCTAVRVKFIGVRVGAMACPLRLANVCGA